MDEPRAMIRHLPDGTLVLDDPDALAVAKTVAKHNCRNTLALQQERVAHFSQRIKDNMKTHAMEAGSH